MIKYGITWAFAFPAFHVRLTLGKIYKSILMNMNILDFEGPYILLSNCAIVVQKWIWTISKWICYHMYVNTILFTK